MMYDVASQKDYSTSDTNHRQQEPVKLSLSKVFQLHTQL